MHQNGTQGLAIYVQKEYLNIHIIQDKNNKSNSRNNMVHGLP